MAKIDNLPLPMHRKLFFSKQVDQDSILKLTQSIIEINEHDEYLSQIYEIHGIKVTEPSPIEIYIDSYGGYVYQVLGLVGIMETSKTPIHTYVTGAAMSCGFIILISGHKRFAYKHSTPLYHQVSTGFDGTTKDMNELYAETIRLQKKLEEITLKRTKIGKKKLATIYKRKIDWYMTPKEAVKYGVVDKIVK